MGMGYRTRRQSEYLWFLQKAPIKAKNTWRLHKFRDVWSEKISNDELKIYLTFKAKGLQKALIESCTEQGPIRCLTQQVGVLVYSERAKELGGVIGTILYLKHSIRL